MWAVVVQASEPKARGSALTPSTSNGVSQSACVCVCVARSSSHLPSFLSFSSLLCAASFAAQSDNPQRALEGNQLVEEATHLLLFALVPALAKEIADPRHVSAAWLKGREPITDAMHR